MTDWISSNDSVLVASVIKHEGAKALIYQYIESEKLTVAEGCDFEHCKANDLWPAYLDTENLATVGVGHLVTKNEAYDCLSGLTDEQVMAQLAADLETHLRAAKNLAALHKMNIDGHYVVQRFMTEMCFNIGAGSYAKFKNGLKKLASAVNNKEGVYSYNNAADEHLDSKWAKQVKTRADEMVDTLRVLDA